MSTLCMTSEYYSTYNHQWKIEIYDNDSTLSNTTFNTVPPGAIWRMIGKTGELAHPINPSTVEFTIMIENSTQELFTDALLTSPENRFTLKLWRRHKTNGYELKFLGNLISNFNHIEDKKYPYTFNITASDGITLLKNIDCERSPLVTNISFYTVPEHLAFILGKIPYIDTYYGTSDPLIEIIGDWTETQIDNTLNSQWEGIKFQNAFYEIKDNTAIFSSCYQVLQEINEKFFFKMYYGEGVFRFEQPTARQGSPSTVYRFSKTGAFLSSDSITEEIEIDKISDYMEVPSHYSWIAGLKYVSVNFDKAAKEFLTSGLSWDKSDSTTYNLSDLVANGTASLYVGYSTKVKTTGTYFDHYYKTRFTVQVGSNYLKRELETFSPDGLHTYAQPTWESSLSYLELVTWFPPNTGGEIDILDGFGISIEFFDNMVIPASGQLSVRCEFVELLDEDENVLSEASYPSNTFECISVITIRVNDPDDVQNGIEYLGVNDENYNKIKQYDTRFGDLPGTNKLGRIMVETGSGLVDSQYWKARAADTASTIEELLINQLISINDQHIRSIHGPVIMKDIAGYFGSTLIYGTSFLMIRGEFITGTDTLKGEWHYIENTKSGLSPTYTIGETTEDESTEKTHLKGIRTSALEASGQTELSITKPGKNYSAGSLLTIQNIDTGEKTETSLATDLGATDTTLDINDALTESLPAWSIITIQSLEEEISESIELYELIEDHSGLTISPTVGTLPAPLGTDGANIRKKVRLYRNGIKLIYSQSISKYRHFNITGTPPSRVINLQEAAETDDFEIYFYED